MDLATCPGLVADVIDAQRCSLINAQRRGGHTLLEGLETLAYGTSRALFAFTSTLWVFGAAGQERSREHKARLFVSESATILSGG